MESLPRPNSSKITYAIIIFIAVLAALFYLLSSILTPFIAGALLAYLFDPLVNRLVRWHLSRLVAVIVVFLLILGIIAILFLVFIPLIQAQISSLIATLPAQFARLQQTVWPWVMAHFGVQTNFMDTLKQIVLENLSKMGNISTWTLQTLLASSRHIFEIAIDLILVPVVTFYLLRDWNGVISKIHDLLPRRIEPTVIMLTQNCDTVLSAFFRGQLLVMFVLAILYSIALSSIGLQAGTVIGVIVGIASIVPYLGSIMGLVIALTAALIQFGTLEPVLLVLVIFAVGHLLENLYLAPKLIGDRVGLHPVVVIFSVLAFGKLFGFFGVLLAIPIASVIMVLLRYLKACYHRSDYYQP